jgi:hypothetical protein
LYLEVRDPWQTAQGGADQRRVLKAPFSTDKKFASNQRTYVFRKLETESTGKILLFQKQNTVLPVFLYFSTLLA